QRRRLPDRAAGVRADCRHAHPRSQRRRAAARRAAGDAIGVPGVAGRAEGAVFGRAAHGELVEVGLAEDDGARPFEFLRDRRVVGKHQPAESSSPPITLGTLKNGPSVSGAFCSTLSIGRDGSTTSSRRTFASGRAWAIGWTPLTSTSPILATYSRMDSSWGVS